MKIEKLKEMDDLVMALIDKGYKPAAVRAFVEISQELDRLSIIAKDHQLHLLATVSLGDSSDNEGGGAQIVSVGNMFHLMSLQLAGIKTIDNNGLS